MFFGHGRIVYLDIANFDGQLRELTELSQLDEENQTARIATTIDSLSLSDVQISLERTMGNQWLGLSSTVETSPIALPKVTSFEYALIVHSGTDEVSVLQALDPDQIIATEGQSSQDLLLATIPVGNRWQKDDPHSIATTTNGDRAYITLAGSSRVSMLGVHDFKQLQVIDLPSGATPGAITIAPHDQFAYIADSKKGKIYVLDINPTSGRYNQVLETLTVEEVPEGIDSIAFLYLIHRVYPRR